MPRHNCYEIILSGFHTVYHAHPSWVNMLAMPKAREWLASYLVGRPDGAAATLHTLAVDELAGADPVQQDANLARLLAL